MGRRTRKPTKEAEFINQMTYDDYMARFMRIATSIFEWVNLPDSMNELYLERTLYLYGCAAFLYNEEYGFINTKASISGKLNIYGLPTAVNCYGYTFQENRRVYSGLIDGVSAKNNECILVMNNYERIPTVATVRLFASRLTEAERAIDVNIKGQKYPLMVLASEKQRLTMKNLYEEVDGNAPVIYGDKDQLAFDSVKVLKTDSPYVVDKLQTYKQQIFNEFLTYIGISTVDEKKERLVESETAKNNELTNMNLQSFLIPRQKAAREFNEKYGLTGTDKEVQVRVRSDLHNIIKELDSTVSDLREESIAQVGKDMVQEEVNNNE